MNDEQLLQVALEAAQRGAKVAADGFHHVREITSKGGAELVTEFDLAAESAIKDVLRRQTPDIAVVAEESGGQRGGDLVWYVDPIDGTTNYAHGHPFWAVSVGLVTRGQPTVGVVVAPALGSTWQARLGAPCLRDDRPCHVSTIGSLRDALLTTGFAYDRRTATDNNVREFETLLRQAIGMRRCGSAALDLCLTASGVYDGYWEKKLRAWDMAAGVVLVRAAGGRVSSWRGASVDVGSGEVLASNGRIHDELIDHLARARQQP